MTPEEENQIVRAFLLELETQCRFAQMAYTDLDSLLQRGSAPEPGEEPPDTMRIFYSVQMFLCACANITKSLWPRFKQGFGETKDQASRRRTRGDLLWRTIGTTNDSKLRDLDSKDLRNYFEHFDEHLDTWAATSQRHILVSRCSGAPGTFKIDGIGSGDYMGFLDHSTREVTFQDLKVALPKMYAAVQYLYERIKQANRPNP
jgi:hypothetical protein